MVVMASAALCGLGALCGLLHVLSGLGVSL